MRHLPRSRALTLLLVPFALSACTSASSENPEGESDVAEGESDVAEAEAPPAPSVASGTQITATLQTALSTKDNAVGDPFTARVVGDVTGADGEVLIPGGSVIRGRLVRSEKSDDPDRQAVLALHPETLVVGGIPYAVNATVTAVDVDAETRDEVIETAKKVGAGAAAGAILGKVIGGDAGDAAKGAIAGAAAGGVFAGVTRAGHATVEPGALLVIRLDQALVLD